MATTLTSQPYINTKTDINDDRRNIFELQKFLQKISESDPQIEFINTDGIYGDETANAVRKFQETRNLPSTGTVDYETWDGIFNEYSAIMEREGDPLPFYVFPIEVLEIKSGDSGDHVVVVQLMLNNFANKYRNLNSISVTGKYNNETANAVKSFQNTLLLTPTGNVDRKTWNEMTRLYRALVTNKD